MQESRAWRSPWWEADSGALSLECRAGFSSVSVCAQTPEEFTPLVAPREVCVAQCSCAGFIHLIFN